MVKILKKRYLILGLVVLLMVAAAVMFFGFVPVASVEGKSASYTQFLKIYGALKKFDEMSNGGRTSAKDLKIKAFGQIIESKLLDIVISRTDSTISSKAEVLLNKAASDTNKTVSIKDLASRLYGLSEADFRNLILLPQAKKDLITEHFQPNQSQLQEIWQDLQKNAKIKIYYPGFYWDNGEVKAK